MLCLRQHTTFNTYFCSHPLDHKGICGCSPMEAFEKEELLIIANKLADDNKRYFNALPLSYFTGFYFTGTKEI